MAYLISNDNMSVKIDFTTYLDKSNREQQVVS